GGADLARRPGRVPATVAPSHRVAHAVHHSLCRLSCLPIATVAVGPPCSLRSAGGGRVTGEMRALRSLEKRITGSCTRGTSYSNASEPKTCWLSSNHRGVTTFGERPTLTVTHDDGWWSGTPLPSTHTQQ